MNQDYSEKVREARIRRAVDRRGYRLLKSRRRDPKAIDFGKFWITDLRNHQVYGDQWGATLDEIETWLEN